MCRTRHSYPMFWRIFLIIKAITLLCVICVSNRLNRGKNMKKHCHAECLFLLNKRGVMPSNPHRIMYLWNLRLKGFGSLHLQLRSYCLWSIGRSSSMLGRSADTTRRSLKSRKPWNCIMTRSFWLRRWFLKTGSILRVCWGFFRRIVRETASWFAISIYCRHGDSRYPNRKENTIWLWRILFCLKAEPRIGSEP